MKPRKAPESGSDFIDFSTYNSRKTNEMKVIIIGGVAGGAGDVPGGDDYAHSYRDDGRGISRRGR